MDQIYTDFTTKLLPQIQEGLVITKEYFTESFGRYIKYLILIDTTRAILSLVTIILLIVLMRKAYEKLSKENKPAVILLLLPIGLLISAFLISVQNIIKDVYIPEIRVYEELRQTIKN